MKYENILNSGELEGSRLRSRSQWLFLEKHCHRSSTFIYGPNLLLLHTNISMKNILIKFKFQLSRAKVNVKVAILRNMLLAV